MHKLCSFIILFLFLGCTSQEEQRSPRNQADLLDSPDVPEHIRQLDSLTVFDPNQTPEYNISFDAGHTFKEIYMGTGGTFSVTVDQQGRLYFTDPAQTNIRAYTTDLTLRDQVGRQGKGPGEFVRIGSIFIHRNSLVVYDFGMRRIQTFSQETLQPVETINIDPQEFEGYDEIRFPFINEIYSLGENEFLVSIPIQEKNDRSYNGYYQINEEGNLTSDKLFETINQINHQFTLPNGMVGGVRLPFTDKGMVAVSEEGTIYTANTSEFLVTIFDPDENNRRYFYYPYKNEPLTREDGLNEFDTAMHDRIRDADFPDYWPALEAMLVDDQNRIWVATITENKSNNVWWILDESGKLLGQFTWTRNETLELVRDGYLYVSSTNSEDRSYQLDRYAIIMEPYSIENQ